MPMASSGLALARESLRQCGSAVRAVILVTAITAADAQSFGGAQAAEPFASGIA